MKCSSCQSELTAGSRICKTCGQPVSVNPALEDLYFSRLAANAPANLVQKARSAPYLAKERRMVTAVLFTVANIDHFKQQIPQEERTAILNQCLDRFAMLIFQYEGTIAKLWENTVMAFFGAPITHEDDPLRAVHAAAAILDDVQNYSKQIEKSYDTPLNLYMVVNSGPILIGEIKSNLKYEFQSLDNTLECMDIAIRSDIPYCTVVLFEDSYRFIKPYIECTRLEDICLQDGSESVQLWGLDHIISTSDKLSRVPIDQTTSLVGRQKELDQLLELSETVLAGLGRVGLILGDSGIGKSRLVLEWKRNLRMLHQPTPILWIEAHGLAFGRDLAYHLLRGLLHSALGLTRSASKQQIKSALDQALLDMIGVEKEDIYRYLAHLLEIDLPDLIEKQIHSLNATELRSQYLNAVRSFLKSLALEQPLIIILEDLHWADNSSVDIITELLTLTSISPILFCLVSREDHATDSWRLISAAHEKIGPRLTRIELGHLNEEESRSLVAEIVGLDTVPEEILNLVLEKSEGNPYFIEELIRMLVNEGFFNQQNDQWVVTENIDPNKIPDSLQGLLTASIDRLPVEAKLTLRIASVIGRNFPEQVLERVMTELAPDVLLIEQLSTLESIGMIKVAQVKPELTYAFRHILLHDAVYHSIIDIDRIDLHLHVGNALETLYPEQKERLASQLAYHFSEAKHREKAYQYLDLAGHVSMDAFATAEAEVFFRNAIQLIHDDERLAHLYTDLGEALAQQSKHREAIQTWKKAIHHHNKLGNTDSIARVYARSARSAWWGYDPKESLEICLEGLQAVQGAVESAEIAYLIHETGRAYLFNNQPEKARAYSEQALEMAKHLKAFDVQAEALATIGILPTVKPQQAIAALEMAIQISESNNLFGPASRAYINLAAVIDSLGDIRLARDYRKRAIQLGNKAGGVSDEPLIEHAIINASLWLADFSDAEQLIDHHRQITRQKDAYLDNDTLNLLFLQGALLRFKGDFKQAIDIYTDLIDRSRQTNDIDQSVRANRALAEVILESPLLDDKNSGRSNIDIALSMVNDAIQNSETTPSTALKVETQCLLSDIYAFKGDVAKAEAALENANDLYRQQPFMQDRVRIGISQARLETAKNNFKKALETYVESINMLEKMEGRWWRARIWLEMGILYLRHNEPEDIDQAQNFFRESLSEFNDLGVNYYPDVIIDKLRQVKRISRAQAIVHRKITHELAEAGRVQHTFIPRTAPDIPGYDISGVLLPASETSGDFYDFIPLKEGKLGIVIADVGDKGAGAALYMAMSRTLIRTYVTERSLEPQKVIQEVNRRILTDTQRGIFLTVVFGVLDPLQGSFSYVNAGHNPPYLLRRQDHQISFTPLEKTGALVGIFTDNTWETQQINLLPEDVLVLYTDGVSEAQNESGDFFGNERLMDALETGFDPSAEIFRNNILESVHTFTGAAPRLDDITLVVVSRRHQDG